MALGCSTNSMLHLPAIAHECGIDLDLSVANEISKKTPNLCHPHNWNLIMAAPVRPFALFAAKLLIVVKLMCFTQCFVFVLYVACGRLFAGFSDWPPVSIVFYLVRGIFGGLAVAAVQLLLAMLIRSFAVPIFLGLVGGIAGMLIGSKGYALLWPYCLMQQGMNANRSTDVLAGNVLPFLLACAGWLAVVLLTAKVLLEKTDVKA